MDASYGRASVLVCRRRYRACIEDDDLGVPRLGGARPPALFELPFDRRPIGLRRTAAKILYVKTRHGNILAAQPRPIQTPKNRECVSSILLTRPPSVLQTRHFAS